MCFSPTSAEELRLAWRLALKPVEQPLKGFAFGHPLSQRAHDPVPLTFGDEPFVLVARQKANSSVPGIGR